MVMKAQYISGSWRKCSVKAAISMHGAILQKSFLRLLPELMSVIMENGFETHLALKATQAS